MNQDNPYAMNQTCKVCGEPAAGFHFGAFTCEGCKSFFGRSYNNLSSISDCKNNGECVINKKNRTACKACRLRKCLMVGMSKSGSRYGRRSNWFKIHCLLQEQQQQAAAAIAAHHNSQHQQQQASAAAVQHSGHSGTLGGSKALPGVMNVSSNTVNVAALSMLGQANTFSGLYPPRTKEELLMLGLEDYSKHAIVSPSVSSPDSHNSDSSAESNVRSNPLLHLGEKYTPSDSLTTTSGTTVASIATPQQLRKGLTSFIPLSFPSLASLPVMPPPAFVPPSHLLFSGYHPALYQHNQGLLKPSVEHQQAAAVAVQNLFKSNNIDPTSYIDSSSYIHDSSLGKLIHNDKNITLNSEVDTLNNNNNNNNNNIDGVIVAEEISKRFYLEAVLKSQRSISPSVTSKPPASIKHDYSISALVTPNSESGREQILSEEKVDIVMVRENASALEEHVQGDNVELESECGEELVVSMTPPRSPTYANVRSLSVPTIPIAQEIPIDLSLKTVHSYVSLHSSNSSSAENVQMDDSEKYNLLESDLPILTRIDCKKKILNDDTSNDATKTANAVYNSELNNKSINVVSISSPELDICKLDSRNELKRKDTTDTKDKSKRMKLDHENAGSVSLKTTTPLDLTTKV